MLEFESTQFLINLKECLYKYIANAYNPLPEQYKQKREIAIHNEYKQCTDSKFDETYDIQLKAISVINDLKSSHLLAENDVILPHIVREYKELKQLIVILNNELKRLNQFEELREHIPVIKPKDFDNYMYKDLTIVITSYNIDCNIKEIMAEN